MVKYFFWDLVHGFCCFPHRQRSCRKELLREYVGKVKGSLNLSSAIYYKLCDLGHVMELL